MKKIIFVLIVLFVTSGINAQGDLTVINNTSVSMTLALVLARGSNLGYDTCEKRARTGDSALPMAVVPPATAGLFTGFSSFSNWLLPSGTISTGTATQLSYGQAFWSHFRILFTIGGIQYAFALERGDCSSGILTHTVAGHTATWTVAGTETIITIN